MQNSNFTKHPAFSPGTIMVNRKGGLSFTLRIMTTLVVK